MSTKRPAPSPTQGPAPTAKQQSYLRRLALERGRSFVPPRTRREASALIDALRSIDRQSDPDRLRELRAIQRDLQQAGGAARVRDCELDGYGSSATWAERS